MTAPNHNWRNFKNAFMQTLTFVCAILVVMPLLLVFYHLIKEGFSSINLAFFTQLPKPVGEIGGGMGNAIVGTFILLGQAAVIGVPVGVLGGVFLSEYGGTKLNWWIRFAADILNGVPSITWGIVVYALMVVPMHGFSALAGGVVLGMMMIPLVMRTTEEVLQLVPGGYREAALALGISKWKTIVQIVIRTALKGIVTGVLLALARVAGETAPLMFTALGNLVLGAQPDRTHRRNAAANFRLRDFALRRLAPAGVGGRTRAAAARARHQRRRALFDARPFPTQNLISWPPTKIIPTPRCLSEIFRSFSANARR